MYSLNKPVCMQGPDSQSITIENAGEKFFGLDSSSKKITIPNHL